VEETWDRTEQIVRRWREIRPDLDPAPMLIIARIARLAVLIDDLLRPPFAAAGLASGDFDLLAALRRQGPPNEASPGDLAVAMLVTTGATTKRIDRLERQGYVTRRPSDTDGRGRVVALTTAGRNLVDRLFTVHLANEASILAALPETQRSDLADLLAELAKTVEAAVQRGSRMGLDGPLHVGRSVSFP
jgi:DNA-binding MarR family transcriptional regulator